MESNRPYVVTFTITYRNSILVYANSPSEAEDFASELYNSGEFDPENNGYDGCDIEASPATPEQIEDFKYDTFDASEPDENEEEE